MIYTGAENDAFVGASLTMIIMLAVITVVHITLWLYYKERPKIDQGFCFSYFKLSYRRRFKRDMWNMPLVFIFIILFLKYFPNYFPGVGILLITITILLSIIQLIYNYKMWKRNEA